MTPFQWRVAFCSFLVLIAVSTRVSGAEETSPEEIPTFPPVFVTAARSEEEIVRVPAPVSLITQEEIRQSNATHVGELLKEEAGLWMTNTSGPTPSGVLIDGRGFNNGGGNGGRMLVLIDGRRANLVDTSSPDWTTLPVDSIERIEIVRGSNSALYGDNAVAGVINIITKKGEGTPAADLSLERGSYDFWKRRAAFSGGEGPLSYYLYGGYESTDGYRENSDYRASNYVGNFGYEISSSSTIRLRTDYLSNQRLLPGALTEAEIASVGRRGSVTPGDEAATREFRIDLGLDSHLDQAQWVELSAGQTLRGQDSRSTTPGQGFFDLEDDSRSTALTGKYRITRPLAGRENRLLIGADLLKETVQSRSFTNFPPFVVRDKGNYERRLTGVYANEEFAIHPALLLTVAGRMDWSEFTFSTTASSGDRSFRVFSPKAGLTYLVTPSASIFASWSRSFRFPNRDELTGFFGLTPELDPERATVYEAGSNLRSERGFEGHLSFFRMTVKDEILFVSPPSGAFTFGENQNVPEVLHDGIEATAAVRLGDAVRLRGGYTFTRTEITEGPFEGGSLPITPRHAGSAALDVGGKEGWRFSLIGRFVGKRILANDLENVQERLPSYAVFDTKLGYSIERFEIFFGVNNLLNKEYEEFGGVGGFPFGSRIGVYPSPERNYIGGAAIRF